MVNDLLTSYFPEVMGIGFTAEMEEELDETAALLSQHRIEQALLSLEETGRLALEAEDILADIEKATQTLGEHFGALAAPAESELKKAYDRLQGILDGGTRLLPQRRETSSAGQFNLADIEYR